MGGITPNSLRIMSSLLKLRLKYPTNIRSLAQQNLTHNVPVMIYPGGLRKSDDKDHSKPSKKKIYKLTSGALNESRDNKIYQHLAHEERNRFSYDKLQPSKYQEFGKINPHLTGKTERLKEESNFQQSYFDHFKPIKEHKH